VSHGEYADGTERWTDRRTDARLLHLGETGGWRRPKTLNMGWQCWRYPGAVLCRYLYLYTSAMDADRVKMSLRVSDSWLSAIRNFLKSTKCWLFSETTLVGCAGRPDYGTYLWTAGQRIDKNINSLFVWRANPNSDTVTVMTYVNWHPGQPDYSRQRESCMNLWGGRSCTWNDAPCNFAYCSVCEIDMNTWSNTTSMRSNCSTYIIRLVANVLRTSITA